MSFDDISKIIALIAGTVTIAGFLFSFITMRVNVITQFYAKMEEPEFIRIRQKAYNATDEQIEDTTNTDVATVINVFCHWATMAKYHYIPMRTFKGGNGSGIISLYKKVSPYIDARREDEGRGNYAKELEDFVEKIEKVQKRAAQKDKLKNLISVRNCAERFKRKMKEGKNEKERKL